jgi:hypothetical protein
MDVTARPSEVPRPLARHQSLPLHCPVVETRLVEP